MSDWPGLTPDPDVPPVGQLGAASTWAPADEPTAPGALDQVDRWAAVARDAAVAVAALAVAWRALRVR